MEPRPGAWGLGSRDRLGLGAALRPWPESGVGLPLASREGSGARLAPGLACWGLGCPLLTPQGGGTCALLAKCLYSSPPLSR